MSTGATGAWGAFGALAVVITAFFTYLGVRYSAQTSARVNQTAADSLAYTKAMEIWETAVAEMRTQVGELKTELAAEKRDARRREDRLESRIEQLETTLSALGHSVPAWPQTTTGGAL